MLLTVLQWLQLAVFVLTALAALRLWHRHRSRPAGFLALAFGALAAAIVLSRLLPPDGDVAVQLGRDLIVAAFGAFPWLLALFAWSFEGRPPRWLLAAGGGVAALAVWSLVLPPLPPPGEPRPGAFGLFAGVFILVWAVLSLAAGIRLWRAGTAQPLVRARTRTMAAAAVVLTVALLISGNAGGGPDSAMRVVATALSVVAAVLFLAGFAPPQALRLWWRRRTTRGWSRMQDELIAAATPAAIAEAVVPFMAEAIGVGVALGDRHGQLLAAADFPDARERLTAMVQRSDDAASPDDLLVRDTAGHLLLLRTTPYTPLFGEDERDLVEGFRVQLRLALERAALFAANLETTDELRRRAAEQQAMITGLAHDLRNPAITIGGFADLLRDADDREERSLMLDNVEHATVYLNQLVDALVELARVGQVTRDRVEVDLDALVDGVEQRLALSHPQLRVVRPTPLPRVVGDPLGLGQVFDNLLTNAARHGGRDDVTVTVRSVPAGAGDHVIEVADDGRGVDPSDEETIFVTFRRGRSAGAGGSGVGLGLVRRVVEAHGGSIELAPAEVGARFVLRLPADTTDPLDTRPFARPSAADDMAVTDPLADDTPTAPVG
jgi:signal transduction histidine kinase